ncbi:hypothetical protein FBU30_010060 [Linnemannia zychae]|nr:hypothetical protein FBU30_010060 [Linnemannia zychae]
MVDKALLDGNDPSLNNEDIISSSVGSLDHVTGVNCSILEVPYSPVNLMANSFICDTSFGSSFVLPLDSDYCLASLANNVCSELAIDGHMESEYNTASVLETPCISDVDFGWLVSPTLNCPSQGTSSSHVLTAKDYIEPEYDAPGPFEFLSTTHVGAECLVSHSPNRPPASASSGVLARKDYIEPEYNNLAAFKFSTIADADVEQSVLPASNCPPASALVSGIELVLDNPTSAHQHIPENVTSSLSLELGSSTPECFSRAPPVQTSPFAANTNMPFQCRGCLKYFSRRKHIMRHITSKMDTWNEKKSWICEAIKIIDERSEPSLYRVKCRTLEGLCKIEKWLLKIVQLTPIELSKFSQWPSGSTEIVMGDKFKARLLELMAIINRCENYNCVLMNSCLVRQGELTYIMPIIGA